MTQDSSYSINDTTAYHTSHLETLGWELTVCNSLEQQNSPIQEILFKPDSYGNLLLDYIETKLFMKNIFTILEVGGGYGYLMRDILNRYPHLKAVMLDISPYLLDKQRETLSQYTVVYKQQDFLTSDIKSLSSYDMAVLNENIGDFPTVCNITMSILNNDKNNRFTSEIKRLITTYNLTIIQEPFNFNIGALQALELLCKAEIAHIFISEHSCEASVPEEMTGKIDINPTHNPEQIRLKGHDEYTIRFSHLENIAQAFKYRIIRGCFYDFIKFKNSAKINYILTSNSQKDEHEVVRLFIEDLFKYEYLLLIKQ